MNTLYLQPVSTHLRMVSADIRATRDGLFAFLMMLCIVGVWL